MKQVLLLLLCINTIVTPNELRCETGQVETGSNLGFQAIMRLYATDFEQELFINLAEAAKAAHPQEEL